MGDAIFEDDDPVSSDEEEPVKDADSCNQAEIKQLFNLQYNIVTEATCSSKRTCGLHLSLSSDSQRFAVSLSRKEVQIYDINKNGLSRDTANINFAKYKDSICGVKFFNQDPNILMASTVDGRVFMYDLRSYETIHTFEDASEGPKKTMTSFDINHNDRVLCASTDVQKFGDCFLLFFDIRERKYLGSYWECHSEDITRMKFHPTNPDYLVSGSIDGLINVFDISQATEDDAMKYCLNMEGCVENLNWHKSQGKELISCISTTNDLHIFNVESQDLEVQFLRSKVTECMKRTSLIDCNLINMHNDGVGDAFLLASSNFNKGECLRSLKLQNKTLTPLGNFAQCHQIIRSSVFCQRENFMITTGESGTVSLWKCERNPDPILESASSKLKHKLHISSRVKPY